MRLRSPLSRGATQAKTIAGSTVPVGAGAVFHNDQLREPAIEVCPRTSPTTEPEPVESAVVRNP